MDTLKNISKRALAMAMAVVMCAGMLSTPAFAADLDEHDHDAEVQVSALAAPSASTGTIVSGDKIDASISKPVKPIGPIDPVDPDPVITRDPGTGPITPIKPGIGGGDIGIITPVKPGTGDDKGEGEHVHDWTEATCTAPKTCKTCGETEGEVAHVFAGGDCRTKSICTECGAEGDYGEHNWDTQWTNDGTYGAKQKHWHKCLNEGCTATKDEADHTYYYTWSRGNSKGKWTGTCTECGSTTVFMPLPAGAPHTCEFVLTTAISATEHCKSCECGAKDLSTAAAHNFKGATLQNTGTRTCTDCFYVCEHTGFLSYKPSNALKPALGHRWDCSNCKGWSTASHNNDVVVAHKDATCTETGVKGGTYCVCGYGKEAAEKVIPINSKNHTPGEAVQENVVEATCTEDGSYDEVVYCSGCNKELSREEMSIPATGHDWQTESDANGHWDACTRCDAVQNNDGHTPGDAVKENEVPATCTNGSYDMVVYCTECGYEISRETTTVDPVAEHKWGQEKAEPDKHWRECQVCGAEESLPHVFSGPEWFWNADGTRAQVRFTCMRKFPCGTQPNFMVNSGTDFLEDRSFTADQTDATCLTGGKVVYTATIVFEGKEYSDTKTVEIPATGHSFTNYVSNGDATCTEDGTKTALCDNGCGATDTITDEGSKHHDLKLVPKVEPTCTSTGVTKHYECKICGALTRVDKETPATLETLTIKKDPNNHTGTPGEWVIEDGQHVKYYSCCGKVAESGEHTYGNWQRNEADEIEHTCTTCGYTETYAGEAEFPEHDCKELAVPVDGVAPTCTEEGIEAGTRCPICGTNVSGFETIPALGHAYGDWTVETPAEVGFAGTLIRTCTVCGESEWDTIPALADDSQVDVDDVALPLAAGPVTRAEFVDYLWRHEGEPEAALSTFVDVPADHACAAAIGWGQSINIVYGVGGDEFAPDELVTVEQVRLFLTRFAAWKGMDMPELTTLTGEDGAAVLNCDEVLAEFFGEDLA